MNEPTVSDDLWFGSLSVSMQERIAMLYGGRPDEIRDQIEDYENRLSWGMAGLITATCDGECSHGIALRKELAELKAAKP